MTADDTLSVRIRIGDEPEWTLGVVSADHAGQVEPYDVGTLLIAAGTYMHQLIAQEQRDDHEGETA